MIQLLAAWARPTFIVAILVIADSTNLFAQTPGTATESASITDESTIGNSSLTHDAKATDNGTSLQAVPSAGLAIPGVLEVEIQARFNELRRELLDDRSAYLDRWLSVVAIVLTFFGLFAVVGGYLGFKRFREIESEANSHLQEIVNIRAKSDEILHGLNAQTVADNPDEAKQTVENVQNNPEASSLDKAVARAVYLQNQDRVIDAIETWRAVAHVAEESDNDLATRAWFSVGYLIKDDNLEDKISAYDKAIRLQPNNAVVYNNRGAAKAMLRQLNEAIDDYDEAIRLQPDYATAYNNRGLAKAGLERFDEAITDYDEAIRLQPDYADAYYSRGLMKARLEQFDEAIADYDEAIRLNPDYAHAYYGRGLAKAGLERFDEAITDYDEAIRLKLDYAEAYHSRDLAKAKLK